LDTVIALANLTYDAETNTYKLHPSDEKVLSYKSLVEATVGS
jgi:hypothetical protein